MPAGKDKRPDAIEFVSYDGTYPCLCLGTLVLRINGEEITFGSKKDGCKYGRFWRSGGSVSFDREWNGMVMPGPWEYHAWTDTPDIVRRNSERIMALFNENVRNGCCGGCI